MGPFFVLSVVSIHEWICFSDFFILSLVCFWFLNQSHTLLIEVEFIYYAVLVLSIQQSDSVIY